MSGTSRIRQVIGGASIGNAVEWYDFAVYVIAAALISLVTVLTVRESAGRPLPDDTRDEVVAR